jgi:anaerobic selenocysteine-containing dehydrogenase
MNRRTFLKIASMGSVAVAAGCSAKSEDNLFTMVNATEDMVTGKATWYASTCRECPAGCGVLAKNREGRIIKLEGNPAPGQPGNPVYAWPGRLAGSLQSRPAVDAAAENE